MVRCFIKIYQAWRSGTKVNRVPLCLPTTAGHSRGIYHKQSIEENPLFILNLSPLQSYLGFIKFDMLRLDYVLSFRTPKTIAFGKNNQQECTYLLDCPVSFAFLWGYGYMLSTRKLLSGEHSVFLMTKVHRVMMIPSYDSDRPASIGEVLILHFCACFSQVIRTDLQSPQIVRHRLLFFESYGDELLLQLEDS
ncbi:hypothetical protein LAZ67_8001274 [Cordylochernes scorpioides]|uniref:Uncharacterized protein n=1 Tax=Cordylochernes scorpioides TaxID=51811 RepID=A0ABY6KQ27_9ARAC|nr:hypothetical protein LAZ67_8001274 [Cordylochernes scorpioides]